MDVREWLPVLTGFIGTLLGWFLNQFGQWFLHRREEKRAIACALSDLLEIRHRFLAISRN